MNTLPLLKQQPDMATIQKNLEALTKANQKAALQKAMQNPKAWAAGAINDELSRNLSKIGTDAMYRMAAIAEGMLGYYLDYYREIEKIQLDFGPLLDSLNPGNKERRELMQALSWAKKKLETNFYNFYDVNKQMVDMCNRVDKTQQEKLNEIEEAIYDDVVTSYNTKHLQVSTYLKQGHSSEAYYSTPIELCRQLAQLSNGALYLTPQQLAKHLTEAGFAQKRGTYCVELVK
jgi:hypothetical protein